MESRPLSELETENLVVATGIRMKKTSQDADGTVYNVEQGA